MKTLSILRHAKAEAAGDYLNDKERPLTSRGQKDAQHIGQLLADLGPTTDWIVSSPAQRTRDTAQIVAEILHYRRGIVWQEAIYEADADTLLAVLAEVPTDMEHVLIIGHNPGMEELVSGLAAGSPRRLAISIPTAGLVHLTLEIFGWNQIRWGCGTLHSFVRPKQIRNK